MLLLVAVGSVLTAWQRHADHTRHDKISGYVNKYIDSLLLWKAEISELAVDADAGVLEDKFVEGRSIYKHFEWLAEYYFPASANQINGAPLLEAEASHNLEPVYPRGFQVMEEYIYGELNKASRDQIISEASNIEQAVRKIKRQMKDIEWSDSSTLDALKLNTYAMMIKSLSGFDAPSALTGIEEADAVLESFQFIVSQMPGTEVLSATILDARVFIRKNYSDFVSFNRAVFLKDYCNKITSAIVDYHLEHKIAFTTIPRAIRPDTRSLFAPDAFEPLYFAPDGTLISDAKIALGRKLFYESRLSSSANRSCATCHQPEKAFSDGLVKNLAIVGNQELRRNTPTLINAALQPTQFYDSRITFLEDQVHDVITNRDEMNSDLDELCASLMKDPVYKKLFEEVFPKEQIYSHHLRSSIAAYVRSLVAMNSAFDKYMNGREDAMTVKQRDGFNLFMGKAKCGTCHFMPLFNGSFPPLFYKIESEVLGVPLENIKANAIVDTDSGKYELYHIPHQLFAFKTVTVRNAELTAPYMHNGVFKTLEEVVDFYDLGGGAGIGIELDHQTLAPDPLDLTIYERSALVEFMKALTDTVVHRPISVQ